MTIKLPDEVEFIINKIHLSNFEAFVVGGCVRDSILLKTPKDWDICTSAKPEQIKKIFEKTIDTGIKHGTVTVLVNKIPFEITTYRIDGEYINNRRPNKVEFTASIKEDLSRRDFTVNSMAYNKKEGLIDFYSGQNDLENKIIKCVGNPQKRFTEDALRMLRTIRFACKLGFEIEKDTFDAIILCKDLIKNISQERITSELNGILLHNVELGMELLIKSELLEIILPEFIETLKCDQQNLYHIYTVGNHIINAAEKIESTLYLKLTMLLHDIGKPVCKSIDKNSVGHFYGHSKISADLASDILKRMKYDNQTISRVEKLILYHDMPVEPTQKSIKKWLNKLGLKTFEDLLKVKRADIEAQNPIYLEERLNILQMIYMELDKVLESKACFSLKDLDINGEELIELGFKPGKIIGEILNELVEMVIEDTKLNSKEKLISYVKEKYKV